MDSTTPVCGEVLGNTAKGQCEDDNHDQHDREQRGHVGTEQGECVRQPESHHDIAGDPGEELLGVVGMSSTRPRRRLRSRRVTFDSSHAPVRARTAKSR